MTVKVKKLKQRTIKILRKVGAHILEEPKRLNMLDFGSGYKPDWVKETKSERGVLEAIPACNTKACLAGWTIFLQKPRIWREVLLAATDGDMHYRPIEDFADPQELATEILGITQEQSYRLFFFLGWNYRAQLLGWPEKFSDAYSSARTPKQRAKVTNARIEHFISTNGVE